MLLLAWMKETIQTVLRVRPLSEEEIQKNCIVIVDRDEHFIDGRLIIVDPVFYLKKEIDREPYERRFNLDHLFWSPTTRRDFANQEEVFAVCGAPLVKHLMDGVNGTIMAYGETGSGKTYTMMGCDTPDGEEAGLILRICTDALSATRSSIQIPHEKVTDSSNEELPSSPDGHLPGVLSAELSLSFYEIYNEEVNDLLSQSPDLSCRIRESNDVGAYVENLTRKKIVDHISIANILKEGNARRAVTAFSINSTSSRSHAVVTLYLSQQIVPMRTFPDFPNLTSGGTVVLRESKICLVDLAGSEKASLDSFSEERQVEATCIDKSLLALGNVLKALTMVRDIKCVEIGVPYRSSVLTFLLKDCLSGNSKTCILATISPSDTSFDETMRTLGYLERAKLIFTNAKIKEISEDFFFLSTFQRSPNDLKESLHQLDDQRRSHAIKFTSESASDLLHQADSDLISEDSEPNSESDHLEVEVRKLKRSLEAKQNIINEYENILSNYVFHDEADCTVDKDRAPRYHISQGYKTLLSSYERESILLSTNIESLNNQLSVLSMKVEAEKKRGKVSKLKSSNELQSTNILGSEFKNNFNDAQRQIKETTSLNVNISQIENVIVNTRQSGVEKYEEDEEIRIEEFSGLAREENVHTTESQMATNNMAQQFLGEIEELKIIKEFTGKNLLIINTEDSDNDSDGNSRLKAENSALKDELKRARNLYNTEKETFSQVELSLVRQLNQSEILSAKLEVEKIIAFEELERQLLDFALQYQEQTDNFTSKLDVQELCITAEHSQEMEALSRHYELLLNKERQKFDEMEIKLDNTNEKLLKAEQLIKKNVEYAEHDPTVLGHLLAETKIEYALQKCENEELQQKYRKLEQITVAYKLRVAVMEEEKDDMIAMRKHVEDLISASPSKVIRK